MQFNEWILLERWSLVVCRLSFTKFTTNLGSTAHALRIRVGISGLITKWDQQDQKTLIGRLKLLLKLSVIFFVVEVSEGKLLGSLVVINGANKHLMC